MRDLLVALKACADILAEASAGSRVLGGEVIIDLLNSPDGSHPLRGISVVKPWVTHDNRTLTAEVIVDVREILVLSAEVAISSDSDEATQFVLWQLRPSEIGQRDDLLGALSAIARESVLAAARAIEAGLPPDPA